VRSQCSPADLRHEDQLTAKFDVWLKKGARTMKKPKADGAGKKRTTGHIVGGRNSSKALSALRHGIFLREGVIPGVESVREVRRFQSKVIAALAPRNEIQRWMAMRIVKQALRLNRLEMYEAAVIAKGQQRAEEETAEAVTESGREAGLPWTPGGFTNPRLLELSLKAGRSNLALLMKLPNLAPETKVKRSEALEILSVVADFAGVKLEEVVDLSAEKVEDVASVLRHPLFRDWTPTEILEVISAIAHRTDKNPDGLRQGAALRLGTMLAYGEAEAKVVFAARDHQRRLRLLPDSDELDRVLRYEAHVWRHLVRAIHEYEALQARDRGERVPLARLDVEGIA